MSKEKQIRLERYMAEFGAICRDYRVKVLKGNQSTMIDKLGQYGVKMTRQTLARFENGEPNAGSPIVMLAMMDIMGVLDRVEKHWEPELAQFLAEVSEYEGYEDLAP